MKINIKLLPSDEVFIGIRISITKMITDLSTYSPEKQYPKAYGLDIGFLFGSIEMIYKGSN
jgi:hypothetical protein